MQSQSNNPSAPLSSDNQGTEQSANHGITSDMLAEAMVKAHAITKAQEAHEAEQQNLSALKSRARRDKSDKSFFYLLWIVVFVGIGWWSWKQEIVRPRENATFYMNGHLQACGTPEGTYKPQLLTHTGGLAAPNCSRFFGYLREVSSLQYK